MKSLLLCLLSLQIAFAQTPEKRIALVIGVKNYQHIAPLQNTLNDARDMSATLKQKNFEVVELYDPKTKRQMQEAVMSYFKLLEENPKSIGMVFYSGHGMQVDGSNYLIPAQANPKLKADMEDQCLNMDYVMRAIEQAGNPLNIFVLDACRNNPFRGFYRSTEQGLSMVSTPKGSYIVYATKPGSVASDGTGNNGLFTSKLLKYLNAEGLNIEQVFKRVASDVAVESNDAQRPWIASDYTGDFYFTPGNSGSAPTELTFTPMVTGDRATTKGMSSDLDFGYDDAPTVLIDSSEWSGKNLNVDHFANGKKIPEAKTETEWRDASNNRVPAWCYFNNDPNNGKIYGKLYNWYAVTDPRKLCPADWHVATDEDWTKLTAVAGTSSAIKLKSMEGWYDGKNGSDALDFAAMPGGWRTFKGSFGALASDGFWWTSTEEGSNIYWAMHHTISLRAMEIYRTYAAKGAGFSVRCVKD